MINATKEIHHLLTRIFTFVSHIEHSNGSQGQWPSGEWPSGLYRVESGQGRVAEWLIQSSSGD